MFKIALSVKECHPVTLSGCVNVCIAYIEAVFLLIKCQQMSLGSQLMLVRMGWLVSTKANM